MSYDDWYTLVKSKKQFKLDELDDMMLYRFKAGIDFTDIKTRKIKLLHRIATQANALFLNQEQEFNGSLH